jgi:hypothetical protein
LPWRGSGWRRVSREPEAVMICCSLVPENWPSRACVTLVGGWMVREYKNMFDVVAILTVMRSTPCAALGWIGRRAVVERRLMFILDKSSLELLENLEASA